jgi:hypothetical protein
MLVVTTIEPTPEQGMTRGGIPTGNSIVVDRQRPDLMPIHIRIIYIHNHKGTGTV